MATKKRATKNAKRAAAKSAARPTTSKKSGRAKPRKPSAPSHTPTRALYGWITHTELASEDPAATKAWCAKVFGWSFKPSFPTPAGDYHLFAYSEMGGGGIRGTAHDEAPGVMPFVHVASAKDAFAKAVAAGATPVSPPERVMEGVTVAVVRAPGGLTIGLSGP